MRRNPESTRASGVAQEPWWKSAVVYQIWPRSFADADGDGIGDLAGIRSRIDYLAALGVDVLWLSPIYPSPQADAGYDISDYQAIDPTFGSLKDFDELLAATHERGMRVILDMVVNHTSDEHPWFVESRSSHENPKRDWYWWRPARDGLPAGEPGTEPNNWGSLFSGSACNSTRGPASTTCTSSRPSSPTSTGRTPSSAPRSIRCCAGGWTAASTAFAWTF
jgi:oligo-1,6-glucosidase